ncbi:multidrug effflux MFS transporter [Amylibacter sp.]|nr:multidrug effflux MFS transporter [Amylibacter sp.]MDA9582434.1 multidrug effflux MFS transporter [Amylibacter sp.]MDB2600463.1 multidrug effflux MFS transporter [Amylibacter sp.]MDB2610688.1 multidrug effflux MFS transporter [Amylibacter sp.]MDC0604895.1 multidrug effflux MFS transporter [Amylibacter sp.]
MKFLAAKSNPHLITLIFITAASIVSLNMFLPSLANMATEFDVSYRVMNISVAGYLAVTAFLQIIIGPLSDRYGRRIILLFSVIIFCFSTIGCIYSSNIWWFLFFRILQGAMISGAALSRAIVRDMMDSKNAVKVLSIIAMAMAIVPMIAPLIGGFLDELYGWRTNFWVYLIMGVSLLVLIWLDLGETNTQKSDTFHKQFSTYPKLFKSGKFWGYSICMSSSVACFYGFLSGAPLVATKVLNLPPTELGLLIGTTSLGFFIGSFFSTKFSKYFGLTQMILVGRVIAVFGISLGLILVLKGYISTFTIFGSMVFIGLGNGFSLPSSHVGIMNVRSDLAGSASGLSGAMAVAFGAIVATLMGVMLTEENGAYSFLFILLITKLISLIAAYYVHIIEASSKN